MPETVFHNAKSGTMGKPAYGMRDLPQGYHAGAHSNNLMKLNKFEFYVLHSVYAMLYNVCNLSKWVLALYVYAFCNLH